MAETLTLPDVPAEVLTELADRAARAGRSLEDHVRAHLVEWTSRPDAGEWVARVIERKAVLGGVDLSDLGAERRRR